MAQEDLVKETAAKGGVTLHETEMGRARKLRNGITAYQALQRTMALWYDLKLETFPAVEIAAATPRQHAEHVRLKIKRPFDSSSC